MSKLNKTTKANTSNSNAIDTSADELMKTPAPGIPQASGLDAVAEIIDESNGVEDPGSKSMGLIFDYSKFVTMNNGMSPIYGARYYNPLNTTMREENGAAVEEMKVRVGYNDEDGRTWISAMMQIDAYNAPCGWIVTTNKSKDIAVNLCKIPFETLERVPGVNSRDHFKYYLHYTVDGKDRKVLVTIKKSFPFEDQIKELASIDNAGELWVKFNEMGDKHDVVTTQEHFYHAVVALKFEHKDVLVKKIGSGKAKYYPSNEAYPWCANGKYYFNQAYLFSMIETWNAENPSEMRAQKVHEAQVRKAVDFTNRVATMNNKVNDVVLTLSTPQVAIVVDQERTTKVAYDTLESIGVIKDGSVILNAIPDGKCVIVHPYKVNDGQDMKKSYILCNDDSDIVQRGLTFVLDENNSKSFVYAVEFADA